MAIAQVQFGLHLRGDGTSSVFVVDLTTIPVGLTTAASGSSGVSAFLFLDKANVPSFVFNVQAIQPGVGNVPVVAVLSGRSLTLSLPFIPDNGANTLVFGHFGY